MSTRLAALAPTSDELIDAYLAGRRGWNFAATLRAFRERRGVAIVAVPVAGSIENAHANGAAERARGGIVAELHVE